MNYQNRSGGLLRQPDLQGLEITKGELKHLTGISLDSIFRPPTWQKFFWEGCKTCCILGLVWGSYLLMSLIFPPTNPVLIGIHVAVAVGVIFEDIYKILVSRKNLQLIRLFEDVIRYNSIVKAIEINDQIEAAGNPHVQIKQRPKVIEALKLIREDLVRALKTERILRVNQKFMTHKSELFNSNFQALTGLQIHDRISEHGRLLNEALEIAVGVHEEIKKLQNVEERRSR